MKKILIILSLILSCNIANAAGVSCWEEYTTTTTPPTTSALRTAITAAGGTSYLVSTIAEGFSTDYESGSYGRTMSSIVFKILPENARSYRTLDNSASMFRYLYFVLRGDSNSGLISFGSNNILYNHYVHTYCTVNSSSGGGGGTILSAPVVFLIKATS